MPRGLHLVDVEFA